MGLFDALRERLSGGGGGAVASSIDAAAGLTREIGSAIRGNEPVDQGKLAELETKLLNAQAEINRTEAQHKSVFVAGWRPFIGWVCGVGIAIAFVVKPIVEWFVEEELPALDVGQLIALVVAMLGVAGYRTYEKRAGVQDRH